MQSGTRLNDGHASSKRNRHNSNKDESTFHARYRKIEEERRALLKEHVDGVDEMDTVSKVGSFGRTSEDFVTMSNASLQEETSREWSCEGWLC